MNNAGITQLIGRLQAAWLTRQPRERRALAALVAVISLLLLVQLGWSLERARQAAQHQVPRLAADAERMRALAGEWQLLSTDGAAPAVTPEMLRQSIDRQLVQLGRTVTARWLADGELQLQGQVEFDAWTRWTAAMQQQNRLVAERIQIVAAPPGIRIDASYRVRGDQ